MPLSLLSRRDILRAGGLGVAATLLPGAARADTPKAKTVLLLNMMGGVTHHDSFDPKPDAPEEIRGSLTTIQTTLPGIRFTEVMPEMAKQTERISLIRTFATGNDDHLISQAMGLSGRMVNAQQIATE